MNLKLDFLPKHEEIKIYQDYDMFCINTDTMVLGEFLDIKHKDIVLDIGTNTGALLLYANIYQPRKLVGIDINKKALEIAKKNMEINYITNVQLIHADGNTFKYEEEFDVIICNPPYFKTDSHNFSKNSYLKLAKHEENFNLDSMINCINRNLKNNGTLFFLFLTSRLNEVMSVLTRKKLIVKKLQFVFDENKKYSNVVLIKAVKGAKEGVVVEKPIIITR